MSLTRIMAEAHDRKECPCTTIRDDDARNRKEFDRSTSVRFVLSGDHGGQCLHGLRETVNTIIGRWHSGGCHHRRRRGTTAVQSLPLFSAAT